MFHVEHCPQAGMALFYVEHRHTNGICIVPRETIRLPCATRPSPHASACSFAASRIANICPPCYNASILIKEGPYADHEI